jgi:hypothetical protein
VAQANQIIGDGLRGNEAYLRHLWIDEMEGAKAQVIHVPTENRSTNPRSGPEALRGMAADQPRAARTVKGHQRAPSAAYREFRGPTGASLGGPMMSTSRLCKDCRWTALDENHSGMV